MQSARPKPPTQAMPLHLALANSYMMAKCLTVMPSKILRPLNPKKLLLSKWTATQPSNKEKHFLVRKVIFPKAANEPIEFVELEAVINGKTRLIAWRELSNSESWLQGWK